LQKEPIIKVIDLHKFYPGVEALKGVSIDFYPGEIHAIVGENGAGKSTLVEIIAGNVKPSSGKVIIAGQEFLGGINESIRLGVGIVHQDRHLVPSLNAIQNIFLGREKFIPNDLKAADELKDIMNRTGIQVDIRRPVKKLGEGDKELVEILRVLWMKPKVMILDEPTAVLGERETEVLFRILRRCKQEGIAVIIITHRLEEVFEVADKVTVLRNGQKVATKSISEVSERELISMMVEKTIEARYPKKNIVQDNVLLEIRDFVTPEVQVDEIVLRQGEIVGLAGLVGSGRTEFLEALYGHRQVLKGEVFLSGERFKPSSPSSAIKRGVYLLPDNRNEKALFMRFSTRYNSSIAFLKNFTNSLGLVNTKKEKKQVTSVLSSVRLDTARLEDPVRNLSGGNRQKVVLGRWLMKSPRVYLLDEPTQGVDVGAKAEFFDILCELINSLGIGVLLASSDLMELLGMCDRIYVFRKGRVVKEFSRREFSTEGILSSMLLSEQGSFVNTTKSEILG